MSEQEDHSLHLSVKLRLTGKQYTAIYEHLFPGDGCESTAVALCGSAERIIEDKKYLLLFVHRVVMLSPDSCLVRSPGRIKWSTSILPDLLQEAAKKHLRLLHIHSHPSGYAHFSHYDDNADKELFMSVAGWLDVENPGISAIMLPDGKILGRLVDQQGNFFPLESILVAGDEIKLWKESQYATNSPEYLLRVRQVFGAETTQLLSQLSVGVVGCSGTGSPTIEMLTRNGVGELVLVDPDVVEEKNLNRIYNTTMQDAKEKRYKVEVLAGAIERIGIGTTVVPIAKDVFSLDVLHRLSLCDVIFGCVDSLEARNIINRLCSFYCIPYFDLGVALEASGRGDIQQVCGAVHSLQPDGSTLLGRGVYTLEKLQAEALQRTDPETYAERLKANYIKGIAAPVEKPIVIHINTIIAGLAINEFLARLHPFRDDENSDYNSVTLSLSQMRFIFSTSDAQSSELQKYVGRGDIQPLLNMPELSMDT